MAAATLNLLRNIFDTSVALPIHLEIVGQQRAAQPERLSLAALAPRESCRRL